MMIPTVDIAARVYNHKWKIDPIVRSLLDTDFYKLLMAQTILRRHPDIRTTFGITNRTRRIRIAEDLAMSTTRDILEDYAQGRGTRPAMLALGYTGWGPGQLDSEILDNGWLTSERGDDIIFGADNPGKWRAALRSLGIDPLTLSSEAGHA